MDDLEPGEASPVPIVSSARINAKLYSSVGGGSAFCLNLTLLVVTESE